MPKATINEAIIEALKREQKPLRVSEVYNRIKEDDLYRFNAIDPEHIVRTQLRRHSENLDFPTAHKEKHFIFLDDGTFWVRGVANSKVLEKKQVEGVADDASFSILKELHKKYIHSFKRETLQKLIEIDPYDFEHFCKKLLEVYGFKNLKVTRKSKDGGLDGYGELKIGLAYLTVAFECKRYSKKQVDRRIINQFRGDIQGKYQQGILFTTSSFNKSAKEVSFQAGAVPIVLIDGEGIVDIMIDKEFGIEKELLPIYSNAIDLALTDNAF